MPPSCGELVRGAGAEKSSAGSCMMSDVEPHTTRGVVSSRQQQQRHASSAAAVLRTHT